MSYNLLNDFVLQIQNIEVAVDQLAEQEQANNPDLASFCQCATEHLFHAAKYLRQAIEWQQLEAEQISKGDFVI